MIEALLKLLSEQDHLFDMQDALGDMVKQVLTDTNESMSEEELEMVWAALKTPENPRQDS